MRIRSLMFVAALLLAGAAHAEEPAGTPAQRAQALIDQGNLKLRQKQPDAARADYAQAAELATAAPAVRWAAQLNLAALAPAAERLPQLQALAENMPAAADAALAARLGIALGAQAAALGAPGRALAWQAYAKARQQAQAAGQARQQAEALDGLAQLYEAQGQTVDALQLTELGVAAAQQDHAVDLLIGLEARRGRLLRAAGQADAARAAFTRSVEYVQQLRHAIPVEYQNGRSSFRDTLEPIYQELADLLLLKGAASQGAEQQQLYRQARDTLETLKQAELDDYLGDRCVPAAAAPQLDRGTAVLYPVLLKDRVDLLVETAAGLYRASTPVAGETIRKRAAALAGLLRDGDELGDAPRVLYDVLLRPVAAILAAQQTDTLIVVPDGALRLLPFGALQDGAAYLIEKYAVAVVPGVSMLGQAGAVRGEMRALLAGMSEAGDVVKKLTPQLLAAISPEAQAAGTGTRGLHKKRSKRDLESNLEASRGLAGAADARERALKTALALPGVKDEVAAIGKVTQGETLLDAGFTRERFRQLATSGQYRLVHIASHGVFGGSAEQSFILAHDDLIGLNALQGYLASEALEAAPIELLTLSACQTAEGNDRAPLGIAGAALKARAKAALGSLWPVSDEAAMNLMNTFYGALARPGTSKVKALQQAQLAVLRKADFEHPFFWAPFILVGNWQ